MGCEYLTNPLGIDVIKPRLSWQLSSERRGTVQSGYQIHVTGEKGLLWDTGKVLSDQSIQVAYDGPSLHSGQRCAWQVRVWDGNGQPSDWSESAWWEMGLLEPADWLAEWIEPGWDETPVAFKPCLSYAGPSPSISQPNPPDYMSPVMGCMRPGSMVTE
jgi:alpha-L-rhamnosidase